MESNERFKYFVSTLIRYRTLWIVPAIAGMMLSAGYVMFLKSESWTARQTLIVRDDMLGQTYKPGQFASAESMKSAQETLLEIARKPQVIQNALIQLGPPSKGLFSGTGNWPSEETIESVQGMVSFSAPNGAEFGKTEVVVLNVRAQSRDRTRRFMELMLDEIDKKMSEVRVLRLQSMESELTQARDAAALSLEQSVKKLRQMEQGLGSDAAQMAGLASPYASGDFKLEISQLRQERRIAENELDTALATQEMLIAANLDPEKALAASADFLSKQPTLQALQTTKVKAQETYAQSLGNHTQEHPVVKASLTTIAAMDQQIYDELENLSIAIENQIATIQAKIHRLDEAEQKELDRLSNLGAKRVDHLTVNSEVTQKQQVFQASQAALAEVQTLRLAAGEVEWLTRIDGPQVATRPDGIGKSDRLGRRIVRTPDGIGIGHADRTPDGNGTAQSIWTTHPIVQTRQRSTDYRSARRSRRTNNRLRATLGVRCGGLHRRQAYGICEISTGSIQTDR